MDSRNEIAERAKAYSREIVVNFLEGIVQEFEEIPDTDIKSEVLQNAYLLLSAHFLGFTIELTQPQHRKEALHFYLKAMRETINEALIYGSENKLTS